MVHLSAFVPDIEPGIQMFWTWNQPVLHHWSHLWKIKPLRWFLSLRTYHGSLLDYQPIRRHHIWNSIRLFQATSDVILEASPLSSNLTWYCEMTLLCDKNEIVPKPCQAWINRCSTAVWCLNVFSGVPWAPAWLIFHCGLGATGRSHSFTDAATDRAWTVITSFPAEKNRFKSRYANGTLHSGRHEVSRLMTGAVIADLPIVH